MAHLERHGIVHRDLAARNILHANRLQIIKVESRLKKVMFCSNFSWLTLDWHGRSTTHCTTRQIKASFRSGGPRPRPCALLTKMARSFKSVSRGFLNVEKVKTGILMNVQLGKSTSSSDVWSFAVVLWELYSRGAVSSRLSNDDSHLFKMPYKGQNVDQIYRDITENNKRLASPTDCPFHVLFPFCCEFVLFQRGFTREFFSRYTRRCFSVGRQCLQKDQPLLNFYVFWMSTRKIDCRLIREREQRASLCWAI